MLKSGLRTLLALGLLTGLSGIMGCNPGGGEASTSAAQAAASINLSSSSASIKSDGSTSTTITVTVLDASKLAVSGAAIDFSATSGQFGVSSGVSSSTGIVTIAYSALAASGAGSLVDRSETVTAKVVGSSVSAQIPVKVTSTAVAPAASLILASSATSIKADGSNSATITATVVDVNGWAVSAATVRFGVKSGSGHFLTASSGPASSDGTVTITYSALSASGAVNQTDHSDVISAEVVGTAATAELSIPVTASSFSLLLGASIPSIKSDGSNSTTITASVLDSLRTPVSGQKIMFTAPTGLLGTSSGDSKADGSVSIPLSALALTAKADRTNRTEVVTASIVGTAVTAQIPIQITGSTLTLSPSKNTAQIGDAVGLTATANDAAGVGVIGQSIRYSIDGKSSGAGTLSATTATTGTDGSTPSVTLTVTAPGTMIINAAWLNGAGNSTLGTSASVVVLSVGIPFAVTSPTANPTSLALSASQAIAVSVPASISGVTVASVRFATTLGTWSNGSKSSTVTPAANAANETLTAGVNSGNANIQIDALDGSGKVIATLNRVFALSAATGTKISLQPSVSIVAPSSGGTTNTATLTANVRDAANNTVGNAPVLFEIVNPTGSGEQIVPVIAYSNSNGQAVAVFSSGSLSTLGGLQIKASIVGADPEVTDTKTINVSGTSVSVTLGQASAVATTNNDTTYTLPMGLLVVSSTGGAVSGATVTLSAFPTHYYRGHRGTDAANRCQVFKTQGTVSGKATTAFPNEDVNENDILDDGEDYDPVDGIAEYRGKGSITPPHASAGSLPPTVATDANGVGTFNLIYLKSYAQWVESRIQAKVVVNGTEFVNELKFDLPASLADASSANCSLPDSPFGP
ncbi:MAG: hypothetical protein D4S02_06675 [Rhodocyclaceae bacterium]|nr:MAG: hypothetical protein D4S02_06675 [Rhodocyclaceae bacterium]